MIAIADVERFTWTARNVRHARHRRRAPMVEALEMMLRALEARDGYTCGHAQRVADYCGTLATVLGQEVHSVEECRIGGLLHDIGKIGITDSILQKPTALVRREYAHIKEHPEVGAAIVGSVPLMRPVLPFILCHHERWDGKGYPSHLKGSDIPLAGRICAVADAFDAMTSSRPYRVAKSLDYALAQLREGRSKQFDPQCVDAFIHAIDAGLVPTPSVTP